MAARARIKERKHTAHQQHGTWLELSDFTVNIYQATKEQIKIEGVFEVQTSSVLDIQEQNVPSIQLLKKTFTQHWFIDKFC